MATKRIQIQIDEGTYEALRRRAFLERRSLAGLIRELIRRELHPKARKRLRMEDFSFIGAGASGEPNRVSEEHDRVLGEKPW